MRSPLKVFDDFDKLFINAIIHYNEGNLLIVCYGWDIEYCLERIKDSGSKVTKIDITNTLLKQLLC